MSGYCEQGTWQAWLLRQSGILEQVELPRLDMAGAISRAPLPSRENLPAHDGSGWTDSDSGGAVYRLSDGRRIA
jgi:hypothetical protein